MSNWVNGAAIDWLAPIYEVLKDELLKIEVLFADELCIAQHNSSCVKNYIMLSYTTNRNSIQVF